MAVANLPLDVDIHSDWQPVAGSADGPSPLLAFLPRAQARRRVVVTGIGVIAASGIGVGPLWDLLRAGRSAVRPLEGFDVRAYPVRIAAQVPGFRARDFMPAGKARLRGRLCQLASAATRLAVEDSGVPGAALAAPGAGLYLGTSAGAVELWEQQSALFQRRGLRGLRPTFPIAVSPNFAAAESASDWGITGAISTISADCPSGLEAVAAACRQIRAGEIDVAIAGGVDAPIAPMLFGASACSGMLASGEVPERACRPFDRGRTGFVIGEGAAMLVLEDWESAVARGARIHGEILGFGSGRDGAAFVGVTDPSGRGFAAAAGRALGDARLDVGDVDFVNAHAPGVSGTDLAEARALALLFGRRGVPVTSIKGAVGQPLGAAGVLQLVSSLLALGHGEIPPTCNCDDVDPQCEVDVVRGTPRALAARSALVTSHGFGGNTTALVLRGVSGPLC
jgi:3-oxoacyl-[acyl-carrier-protein] synthase II